MIKIKNIKLYIIILLSLLTVFSGIFSFNKLIETSAEELPPVKTLNEYTWDEIDNICSLGLAEDYFSIGDEKDIELSTGEVITVFILGFNHDDISNSDKKASITFSMKTVLNNPISFDTGVYNAWEFSDIRLSFLPTIFSELPTNLKNIIKDIDKVSSQMTMPSTYITASEKLFLFSLREVMLNSNSSLPVEGKTYDYYRTNSTNNDRVKDDVIWWLRTNSGAKCMCIGTTGNWASLNPDSGDGYVSFGFSIGEVLPKNITFKDYNNTVLSTIKIDGEQIIEGYFPEEPTRTGYDFIGWQDNTTGDIYYSENDILNLVKNTTLTAVYEAHEYTVTFRYFDNTIGEYTDIQVLEKINYGYELNASNYPQPPIVYGYNFIGWDIEEVVVRDDSVITALYDPIELSVIFKNYNNSVIHTQDNVNYLDLENGVKDTLNDIVITAEGQYENILTRAGYNFIGWQDSVNGVVYNIEQLRQGDYAILLGDTTIEELTLTAVYEIIEYTVIFRYFDNIINDYKDIQVLEKLNYGYELNTSNYPDAPTVYGYNFIEWDITETTITDDVIITALYEPIERFVIFKDYNNITLSTVKIEGLVFVEGDFPENPTRTGHNFIGWQNDSGVMFYYEEDIKNIITDTTLTAVYEVHKYTVTFRYFDPATGHRDIKVYEEVNYGTALTASDYPEAPEVYGYNFSGWYPEETTITQDTVITADYEPIEISVVFKNYDGSIVYTQDYVNYLNLENGVQFTLDENVLTGEYPYKNILTRENYKFIGWQDENDYVYEAEQFKQGHYGIYIGDTTVEELILTAVYEIEFVFVYFTNENGERLYDNDLLIGYGAILSADEIPTPAPSEKERYEFIGWYGVGQDMQAYYYITDPILENVIFEPTYKYIPYTAVYKNIDGDYIDNVVITVVDDNSVIYFAYIMQDIVVEGYNLIGWDCGIEEYFLPGEKYRQNNNYIVITEDLIYSPIYEIIVNTIIFKDYNGDEILTSNVNYFEFLQSNQIPSNPTREHYNFIGWQSNIEGYDLSSMIKDDIVFTAIYEQKMHTVLFMFFDGIKDHVLQSLIIGGGEKINKEDLLEVTSSGYYFVRWESETEGYTVDSIIDRDLVFNPILEKVIYTFNFYNPEGVIILTMELFYDDHIKQTDFPVIENKYGFEVVWKTSSNGDISWGMKDGGLVYFVSSQRTKDFYAQYKTARHRVTFYNINGFSFYDFQVWHGNIIEDEVGSHIYIPEAPEVEGKIFVKWYDENLKTTIDDPVLALTRFRPIYIDAEVNVSFSYYTIERLYYTKTKKLLWFIPIGEEYKYLDFVIYKTDSFILDVYDENLVNNDYEKIIGNGLYGQPKHKNIEGFEFLEWEEKEENNFVAKYNIPKVRVNYYSLNNILVEERDIDIRFVPLPELKGSFDLLEGMIKYLGDIFVKLDFVELVDDFDGRELAKEAVNYLSNRFVEDEFEPYFMIIQPDVHIEAAYGLFKSAAAGVSGGTFKWLVGTHINNDYVYYADLSDYYVKGIYYTIRVSYDTPYDNVVNFVGNTATSVADFFTNVFNFFKTLGVWVFDNWQKVLLAIIAFIIVIAIGKRVLRR